MRFSTIFEDENNTSVEIILATLEYYVRLLLLPAFGVYMTYYRTYFQIYNGIGLATRDGVQTIACSEVDRSEITFSV